jgi:hypothetical protein
VKKFPLRPVCFFANKEKCAYSMCAAKRSDGSLVFVAVELVPEMARGVFCTTCLLRVLEKHPILN